MKVAIMQPYFLPYLGYLSLIKHTDRFILFDTVQFIRHGWIERNRILKPSCGWQYFQVPLIKFSHNTLIKDIQINNEIDWKNKILAQLQHYKKRAPFYFKTITFLNDLFQDDFNNIVELNQVALTRTCKYLDINKNIEIFSESNLEVENANAPDEWALNICKSIGDVDEYWNPSGGLSFFDRKKYIDAGINIKFHSVNLTSYNQKGDLFEPGLSIIDVMMFNDVISINKMLDGFELL